MLSTEGTNRHVLSGNQRTKLPYTTSIDAASPPYKFAEASFQSAVTAKSRATASSLPPVRQLSAPILQRLGAMARAAIAAKSTVHSGVWCAGAARFFTPQLSNR